MRTLQGVPPLQILMVAILAAACASVPSERWTGLSTGEGSGCHPLELTLTITEGEISGYATMQTASVTLYWEATGKGMPSSLLPQRGTQASPATSSAGRAR